MYKSNLVFYVKSSILVSDGAGATFTISTDTETDTVIDTAGEQTSIVLKNDSQIERMIVTISSGTATIVKRGLTQAETETESAGLKKQWNDGDYGYFTALSFDLIDKGSDNTLLGNLTLANGKKLYLGGTTNCYVWSDDGGVNLKFKDSSNSERTLTQLSSLSGSNDKVKVSANDTTEDYLENKVVGGDGINITTLNDGGNEDLSVAIKIDTLTEKTSIVDNDLLIIADSEATNTIKKIKKSNLIQQIIGGNGSDGALNISSGTTTLTLVNDFILKQYSSINISGTAILDITGVSGNNGGIAYIKCKGDFTMSAGTIRINGQGGVGGGGGNTSQAGNGSDGINYLYHYTTSNGGLGSAGAGTGAGASTGRGITPRYSFNKNKSYAGGGGGGGNGFGIIGPTGARGGGILIIEVGGKFNFTGGTIQSNGNNGTSNTDSSGSGGGGGGMVIIYYNILTSNTGTIQCNGGNGGNGTAGGSSRGGGGGGAGFSNGGAGGNSSVNGSAGTTNSWGSGGSGGTAGGTNGGGGGGGAGYYEVVAYTSVV